MNEWVLVPREPTVQSLLDMAITYDHSYGLLPNDARENVVRHMRQLYDAAIRSAPAAPQAEPVGYFQRDHDYFEQVEDVYQRDADVIPLYLHPPPAEVQWLREALDSIRQYGSDTLSGRTDGPDDRKWQRDAVLEMTQRARRALEGK